ncbi:MAG: bacteriophage abortive infection AbiH family protein, partial [Lachnospiraceae bacterium]|nr:bacteriophage abortive infection AbiH family protein [Lachnospiraceae bacterium]
YLKRYAEEFLTEFEKLYSFYPYYPDEYHMSKDMKKEVMERRKAALNDELWKGFECKLGQPSECEFDIICDTAIEEMNYLESGPIGIKDTLNVHFEKQLGFVIKLQDYLLKWARQIRLNKAMIKKDEMLGCMDLFLTFNYTPTLERVYGILMVNILHIHGGVSPYCQVEPIIGHGNTDSLEKWLKWKHEYDDAFNEGGSAKCTAIMNFYRRTLKDTDKQIMRHAAFFNRLDVVDEIVVIGHSFGEVDFPYFKRIVEVTGVNTPWLILYYLDHEKNDMETRAKDLGLKSINMLQSEEYWDR